MFEGWASDVLATYLGRFLEVQREKLRISLFSAWQAGLTLENVNLRADAFNYLQLPFKLRHGRIGRVQAQVPWQALRSPVIIELSDVYICVAPLDAADLAPGAATERDWAAKQACMAAEELTALAAGAAPAAAPASAGGGGAAAEERQGGVLWSFLQRLITALINRLQLSLHNIHIRVEDPTSGRAFGLRLQRLHTCRPGEAEHASHLLAEDAGIMQHSAAAAKGSVQKQFAAAGFSFYWQEEGAAGESAAMAASAPANGTQAVPGDDDAVQAAGDGASGASGAPQDRASEHDVLLPTGLVVHLTSKHGDSSGAGLQVHASAVAHSLSLALRSAQAADMERCADELQWLAVRAKYAHLRPAAAEGGAGRPWRAMWRYAVSAVLLDVKGRDGAAAWQPARAVQHMRRRYVLLYRKKLELEAQQPAPRPHRRTSSSGGVGEGAGSMQDDATTAATLSSVGKQQLQQLERDLSINDIVTCRAAARRSVEAAAGAHEPSAALASDAGDAAQRKSISWGLAKAAGFLGYVPRSQDAEVALPQPSDSEVQELYASVDYHPEDDLARVGCDGGAPPLQLTFGCLVPTASALLLGPKGRRLAAVELAGLRIEVQQDAAGFTAGVTLADACVLDWATHGHGVADVLLARASEDAALQPAAEGPPPLPPPPPLLRLQYAVKHRSAAGGGEPAPTLDMLVEALQAQVKPLCFKALADFVPRALSGSFGSRLMAAVNGLSPEARAAIKAAHVRRLGPCLDLVAKIADVQLVLDAGSPRTETDAAAAHGSGATAAVVLSTGTILVNSASQDGFSTGAASYALLGRILEQRRSGQRTSSTSAHAASPHGASPLSAEGQLAAAVAAVEERLVYQQLEFSVAGLQVLSAQPQHPNQQRQGEEDTERRGAAARGGKAVLRPVRLAGSLKVHRIAEDYGVPQLQCVLLVDPVAVALTSGFLRVLAAALNTPPVSEGPDLAAEPQAPPASAVQEALPPRASGAALATFDVQLSSLELSYVLEGQLSAAEDVAGHVHLSMRSGNLALQALPSGGVATKVNLSGLVLRDLSPEGPLPPAVRGPLLRLAKALSIEGVHVSTGPMPGDPGTQLTDIHLVDADAQGYDGEAGNFISRFHDRQPTRITLSLSDSPSTHHTTVSISNVTLGHATILRILTLMQPSTSSAAAQPHDPHEPPEHEAIEDRAGAHSEAPCDHPAAAAPPPERKVTTAIDLQSCSVVWKYQQSAARHCAIPAALHDFFSLHEDLASLDVPYLHFVLPLEPASGAPAGSVAQQTTSTPSNAAQSPRSDGGSSCSSGTGGSAAPSARPAEVIVARDIALHAATIGYSGRPSLPVLQLPRLQLTQAWPAAAAGEQPPGCSMQLTVQSLHLGMHPSHLTAVAAAAQLYQLEMELLAQEPQDTSTDAESVVTSSPSPPPLAAQPSFNHSHQDALEPAAAAGAAASVDSNQAGKAAMLRLEASLDLLSISLVGSTPSSACLKAEWHALRAACTSGGDSGVDAKAAWQQLSLHVLQPKVVDHSFEFTPFASGLAMEVPPESPGSAGLPAYPPGRALPVPQASRRGLSASLGLAGVASAQQQDSFGEPVPYLMARFSASSVASRYYSAAGSEFDDAASELADCMRSPPGPSPRQPLLPLQLEGGDFDAATLVALWAAESGAGSGDEQVDWVLAVAQRPSELDADVGALTLRLFMHGWESAAECLHTYQTFAAQARHYIKAGEQRRQAEGGAPHALSTPAPSAAPRAPERALNPRPPESAANVSLRGVCVEAVAASGALPGWGGGSEHPPVPVARLLARLALHWKQAAATSSLCVDLPALLLSMGSVVVGGLGSCVQLPYSDALLGVHGASLVVASENCSGGAAEGPASVNGDGRLTATVAIEAEQLSVWVSPRNASVAAAMAQHAAHMAAPLQVMPDVETDKVERTRLRVAAPRCTAITASICSAAVLVSDAPGDDRHQPSPLFELSASSVTTRAEDRGQGCLRGSAALTLGLDVFNSHKLAWEPVLDQWRAAVEFSLPRAARTPAARPHHLRLGVLAAHNMELTATQAVAEAAAVAVAAFGIVPAVVAEPDTLLRRLQAAGAASPQSASYQLHNLTGSGVEVWLASPAPDGSPPLRPPFGPAHLTVAPSGRVQLPVLPENPSYRQSRHSGQPSEAEGVQLEAAVAEHAGPQQQQELPGWKQPRRTLMYFRLGAKGPLSGPVWLDRPESTVHSAQLGQTNGQPAAAAARVVCCNSCAPHGGFTVSLHSGIRIHNSTQSEMEVGVQTPLGTALMEPQPLGCLPGGAAMWLPATWAEAGVLCVRPGASFNPARHVRLPPLPLKQGLAPPALTPRSGVVYTSAAQLSPQRSFVDLASPGAAAAKHHFEWSAALPISALIAPGAAPWPAPSTAEHGGRQLTCAALVADQPACLLCIGAVPAARGPPGASWDIVLAAPVTAHNALPVPVDITLAFSWGGQHRLHLEPNQQRQLLNVEAGSVGSVTLRAAGFEPTAPIVPTPLPAAHAETAGSAGQRRIHAHLHSGAAAADEAPGGSGGGKEVWAAPDAAVSLQELGPGLSSVEVSVRHGVNPITGGHLLRLTCGLWVYNCTGLPISLRQSAAEHPAFAPGEASPHVEEDEVPRWWVPPLQLPGRQSALLAHGAAPLPALTSRSPRPGSAREQLSSRGEGTGLNAFMGPGGGGREGLGSARTAPPGTMPGRSVTPSVAGSVLSVSRAASTADVPGLSEILEGGGGDRNMPGSSRSVLGMKRSVSRARGIADSMETTPAFEMPSRWPSMAGGLHAPPGSHRLRLQLRATQTKAPPGATHWSPPLELDTLGGAAVVAVPCPASTPSAAAQSSATQRAAYPVTVTATLIPGSDGALALCLLPRYVLRNLLDVPIQYKQQGSGGEQELGAGSVRAVRWADALGPPRLCVRVQEAGWMWSGGFLLDAPGDLFVKIRHRDRGITMLVRVDVAIGASGVVCIMLSHNPAGFAPYRVENCSLETLHARQSSVREQQDVLRPYCSLNYAWDEPTQPHSLVLELPGARLLGTFALDKVGQDVVLTVCTRRGEPDKRLRVVVRAEGPTRVLTVLDEQRHLLAAPATPSRLRPSRQVEEGQQRGAEAPAGGAASTWLPPSTSPQSGGSAAATAAQHSGLLWEVTAEVATIGLSLVGPSQEVAYFRATGVAAGVAMSAARYTASLQVSALQLDNPSPWVAFPVTLVMPAPASKLGSTVAAAVEMARRPALEARLAVWQRRPAGVLCVELAELQAGSIGIYVEQQHVMELGALLGSLAAPLSRAAAAAGDDGDDDEVDAAASGMLGGDDGTASTSGNIHAAASVSALPPHLAGNGGGGGGDVTALQLHLLPQLRELLALEGASAGEGSVSGQRAGEGGAGSQKVYIDLLSVSPIEVTVSFMSAPQHPTPGHHRLAALQRLLSLADVEDARLWLSGLQMRNPLMDAAALTQHLQRHYVRALIPELYKIVGAASVFGDPVGLVHHLGLGVWAFVAGPAAGLVESARQRGPRQFVLGVLGGTRGLVQNVVFAVSNAATKASGAARKAIVVWGLDRPDHPWGSGSLRRRVMREEGAGGNGLLAATLRGLVGLVSEPIRGVEAAGLPGLLRGAQRGALGALALPLASLLEMSARLADSIRHGVAGSGNLGWLRPRRHVTPSEPLAPYDWSESMGRWLLTEMESEGRHGRGHGQGAAAVPSEAFVLCVPTAEAGSYLVVTSARVVYVRAQGLMWAPAVLWQAAVADLELAARAEARPKGGGSSCAVRFVAVRAPESVQRRPGARSTQSPFSFLCADCEDAAAAGHVAAAVQALMAATPRRVTVAGHAMVLSSVEACE